MDVAHRMGVESPLAPVCSLTLGPEGVSPLEMTDAFATLATRGVNHRPDLLQRVTGADGEGVLHAIRRVASGATAWPEDSSPSAATRA